MKYCVLHWDIIQVQTLANTRGFFPTGLEKLQ